YFRIIRLSGGSFSDYGITSRLSRRSSAVDRRVTRVADDEGLPPPGRHDPHPCRLLPSAGDIEVGELPDVMDLDVLIRAADRAGIGQESGDQLVPGMPAVAACESVSDLEGDVRLEPDPTEPCDQRLLAGPILPDLETPDASPPMIGPGAKLPGYLRDGRLVLG